MSSGVARFLGARVHTFVGGPDRNKQESPAIADKLARRESLPKLLQFDVPTALSLTILAYLHAFNCYCLITVTTFTLITYHSIGLSLQT